MCGLAGAGLTDVDPRGSLGEGCVVAAEVGNDTAPALTRTDGTPPDSRSCRAEGG